MSIRVPSWDKKSPHISRDYMGITRQTWAVYRPLGVEIDERSVFAIYDKRRRVAHLDFRIDQRFIISDTVPGAGSAL